MAVEDTRKLKIRVNGQYISSFQQEWEWIIDLDDLYDADKEIKDKIGVFPVLDATISAMRNQKTPLTKDYANLHILIHHIVIYTDEDRLKMVAFLLRHGDRVISRNILETIDTDNIPYETLMRIIINMYYVNVIRMCEDAEMEVSDDNVPPKCRMKDLCRDPSFWNDLSSQLRPVTSISIEVYVPGRVMSARERFLALSAKREDISWLGKSIYDIVRSGDLGLSLWIGNYVRDTKSFIPGDQSIDPFASALIKALQTNNTEAANTIIHYWGDDIRKDKYGIVLTWAVDKNNCDVSTIFLRKMEKEFMYDDGTIRRDLLKTIRRGSIRMAEILLSSKYDLTMSTEEYDSLSREIGDNETGRWLRLRKKKLIIR